MRDPAGRVRFRRECGGRGLMRVELLEHHEERDGKTGGELGGVIRRLCGLADQGLGKSGSDVSLPLGERSGICDPRMLLPLPPRRAEAAYCDNARSE